MAMSIGAAFRIVRFCRWASPAFYDVLWSAAHRRRHGPSGVRFGSFSTELGYPPHVRFTPDSDRTADIAGGPVRANNGSHFDFVWWLDALGWTIVTISLVHNCCGSQMPGVLRILA